MSTINKGDNIVLIHVYPDNYYKNDIFVVVGITKGTKGHRDELKCDSLFRNESFEFELSSHCIRKITPSAAQKRIKKAIEELESHSNFLKQKLEAISV